MSHGPDSRALLPAEYARLFCLPPALFEVMRRLLAAGHGSWLCGGTARDLLAGRLPADLDLATAATPLEARACLEAAWLETDQPGETLGTLNLTLDGRRCELTTLRVEGAYLDHRQPSEVRFVRQLDQDWQRRDFTINALYVDVFAAEVLDFCGGLQDLQAKRLEVIGDAEVRLSQDSLRVLRAIRLCAELGLVMDRACWDALRRAAAWTGGLSGARVFAELDRTIRSPGRGRGLMLLASSGVAARVLPDVAQLAGIPQPPEFHPEGDVLQHTALVLANLRAPVAQSLAWAALLHDVGKKDCFVQGPDRIRFDGHDTVSVDKARAWLTAAAAPRGLIEQVSELIAEHIRIASVPAFRPAKRNRFLANPAFMRHLEFHRADCSACHRMLDRHDELLRLWAELPPGLPSPLLRGRDLLALGIPPGPMIGRILAQIEEERFAGTIDGIEQARARAAELARAGSG